MPKHSNTISSVLTLGCWLHHLVDPMHTNLRTAFNTKLVLLVYWLIGLVFCGRKPLFYLLETYYGRDQLLNTWQVIWFNKVALTHSTR
jgi:hypothetical protein